MTRLGQLALPGLRRVGAQEPSHGLGVELILMLEMAAETASRQAGILHHLVDGDLRKSVPVEEAPRAFQNLLACRALVLWRIWHSRFLTIDFAIPWQIAFRLSPPARGDIEM